MPDYTGGACWNRARARPCSNVLATIPKAGRGPPLPGHPSAEGVKGSGTIENRIYTALLRNSFEVMAEGVGLQPLTILPARLRLRQFSDGATALAVEPTVPFTAHSIRKRPCSEIRENPNHSGKVMDKWVAGDWRFFPVFFRTVSHTSARENFGHEMDSACPE
jgi:hypothetical protein